MAGALKGKYDLMSTLINSIKLLIISNAFSNMPGISVIVRFMAKTKEYLSELDLHKSINERTIKGGG